MDNVMPSHMNKHVPLPKIMVPAGKDAAGKPVALQFMGRAGPVGVSDLAYAFDDELLRGLDVAFLRDVDTLVDAWLPRIRRSPASRRRWSRGTSLLEWRPSQSRVRFVHINVG